MIWPLALLRPRGGRSRTACLVPLLAVLVLCSGCLTPSTPDIEADVQALRSILEAQQKAWNRGDLEAFMDGYARTDSLRFASGGSVRTGWETTLENYRSGYPDRTAMGTLTFDDLDVEVMSPRWAMVFGQWRLDREADAPGGLFTLIFHRDTPSDPWRIIHDHTSSSVAGTS